MQFQSAHNETVRLGCDQYRKEIRYYVRDEMDREIELDQSGFFWNVRCDSIDNDMMFTVHNYYSMPGNEYISDMELRENIDEYGHYYYPFYVVQFERCIEDEDGVMMNVQGYEKRRECDDSLLYQEWHIRNFNEEAAEEAGNEYEVGQILYDLDGFTKVRCLSCCGGTRG